MQILPVHYKLSKPVIKFSEITEEVDAMLRFVERGNFKGYYNKAHAVAHCQVSETPYAFFVVSPECVAEGLFPHRVIINPKVLASDTTKIIKPEDFAKYGIPEGMKVKEMRVTNGIEGEEPCLSFPFRKAKRITRFDVISVSFQIPGKLGLKTIKQDLSGIASRIFQHEYDHTVGQNIYFKTEPVLAWWDHGSSEWKPYGKD